jgi:SCY1-like protein 1
MVVNERVSRRWNQILLLTLAHVTPSLDVSAADAYELGLLLHSVFNPSHPLPSTSIPPHPPPAPASRGEIPISMFSSFRRLLTPKARPRLTAKGFLELGNGERAGEGSGFFSQNRLVKICAGLEGFNLSSDSEKTAFLRFVVIARTPE